jgi:hypothetical protein
VTKHKRCDSAGRKILKPKTPVANNIVKVSKTMQLFSARPQSKPKVTSLPEQKTAMMNRLLSQEGVLHTKRRTQTTLIN